MIKLNKSQKDAKKSILKYFKYNYELYVMVLPAIIIMFLIKYIPMFYLTIAFKDYNIFLGYDGSPWVGLDNFYQIFRNPDLRRVMGNTFIIMIYLMLGLVPIPVFIALAVNEIRDLRLKKTLQTVIYLPHFLSWMVVYGIFYNIFSSFGVVNQIIDVLGGEKILFFIDRRYFRFLLLITQVWKDSGWSTIIYLATIISIDPTQYEAATIDGASRLKQIYYVTIPNLLKTIVVVFVLRLSRIIPYSFEQVLALYNPSVYEVADILSTNAFRLGLGQMKFSYGTAVGFLNSFLVAILVVLTNFTSKKLTNGESGLW
jgi:putative aldouronate transport system permease protein